MSNHEDFRTSATHTEDSLTGDATLTGEQGDRQPDPAATKAKNKSNVKMAIILGAVVVAVAGLGYMAFFKHGAPAPVNGGFHPTLSAPATHPAPTPTPVVPPSVTPSVVAHPAPAASAAEAPKLASSTDAQALLGGAPAPTAAVPAGAPNAILGTPPASASTAAGIAPALTGALPNNATAPAATPVAPAPSSTASSPVTAAPTSTPVTSPTSSVVSAALAPQGALEDRVSHLEDRVTDLEKNQSHILEMLATQPDKAIKASQTTATPAAERTHKLVTPHKPKVHRRPANQVEVITPKAKPVVAEKPSSVTKPANAGCQIASIVPNRAWTKQSDGTFLTYGVGDTAPNGSVIKSIDPETGIITEKGKLTCSLAD